eukprot:TRINITY_DN4051_c0_g2_i1.p1 TRINITY_DN4051_c0_g2~~TRINITY_DN4051_c0_g2_i1.p1  ORF type:complete len:283 (+),score=36.06 TRINITY_DN4051_c0_g2_i1:221-1069(+)
MTVHVKIPRPRLNVSNFKDLATQQHHLPHIILLFVFALCVVGAIFYSFPSLSPQHRAALKFPSSLSDVQALSSILGAYTDAHYWSVISAFGAVYLFLQTFSIPGSIFLSFLAGALFGLVRGFLLVCTVATLGALCSYLLSYYLARGLVYRIFPDKVALLGTELARHRQNLLNYLLFLRITPFLPNWFINLASPLLDVPVSTFVIGTFFGIMPATFFAVRAGLTLQKMKSPKDVFDTTSIATLAICAVLSILPTLKPVKNFLDELLNNEKAGTEKSAKNSKRR